MIKSPIKPLLASTVALCALTACGSDTSGDVTAAQSTEAPKSAESHSATGTPSEVLDAVLVGSHRDDAEKARDQFRNPKDTIEFFDITPNQTVVEMFPGRGWYTKVLAPYLATGTGTYVAVNINPGDNERRLAGLAAYKEAFSDKDTYGDVQIGLIRADTPMVEPGSADAVLTFRNVHNWMAGGVAEEFFGEFYTALKPGGVLGVVEHRGDEATEQDPQARSGYVNESTVIAMAQAVGFELEAKSEINANVNDTRDHPFGVWTLPPVKRSSATRGESDPDFDRAKYDAIGESDRMTIKFRKPLTAEGALLE